LVELYPGYPGYAGFVTGVDGVGDNACLEDLTRDHKGFSQTEEDNQNLAAARALGIDGEASNFTWENWLQIEAKRGLPTTCYVCAIQQADYRSGPTNDSIVPNDPRLLLGTFGTSALLFQYNQEIDPFCQGPSGYDDFDLRVLGQLIWSDGSANATQTVNSAYALLKWSCTSLSDSDYFYPDVSKVLDRVMDRGGWFNMPTTATPDDQIFGITGAVNSMRVIWDPTKYQMFWSRLQLEVNNWYALALEGDQTSLANYLKNSDLI